MAVGASILLVGGMCWLVASRNRRRLAASALTDDAILATAVEPVPSTRVLQPADVAGPWQFYVDAAASTVTIDLQPDGRYGQTIVGNSGEQIDGPGGTWSLDGANLDLSDYRSATRKDIAPVRWVFGDSEGDLILFASDDPHSKRMLLARRKV
jgi:hypothetical protein